MHEAFYGKYNGIFRAWVNRCTRPLLGGEGPGDEAKQHIAWISLIGFLLAIKV